MEEDKNFLLKNNFRGDILQEIPRKEIPSLLGLLKKDWPNSSTVYNFITTRLQWKNHEPEEEFYVLCPYGSWEDGTIVCIAASDIPEFTVYSLEDNSENLKIALQNTKLINWKCKYFVCAFIHEKQYSIVLETLKTKGVQDKNMQCNLNCTFYVSHEKAQSIPQLYSEEFLFEKMKLDHAEIMNNAWPFKSERSLYFFQKCIKYNDCLGMFRKSDLETIGWILRSDYGLGSLHVEAAHRRKGYGKMIVQEMIRRMGKDDLDTVSHVIFDNTPSIKLFKSLDCEQIYYVTWIYVKQQ